MRNYLTFISKAVTKTSISQITFCLPESGSVARPQFNSRARQDSC